jgi:hypothetical protein
MTPNDISLLRLINQQIADTDFKTPEKLVSWMGAMQAQDYAMAKMAIGLRLPGTTSSDIEKAVDKGEILRTHMLRPTWHFVAAEDILWMIELSAPSILGSQKSRRKELELTPDVLKKSNGILEKILKGKNHLTRDEIIVHLEKAKIKTHDNRAAHLMFVAELSGIICSGKGKGNNTTYALLSERISTKPKSLPREKALEKLALKYFSSHGPATLKDFTWWSGLSTADSRKALEMVQPELHSEKVENETYWFSGSLLKSKAKPDPVYLLPAFDEFIISYKDRTAAMIPEHHKKAVSNNGIFRPIILVNGSVIGIWKRTIKKDTVIIEPEFFKAPDKKTINQIEEKAEEIAVFLGKELRLKV